MQDFWTALPLQMNILWSFEMPGTNFPVKYYHTPDLNLYLLGFRMCVCFHIIILVPSVTSMKFNMNNMLWEATPPSYFWTFCHQ